MTPTQIADGVHRCGTELVNWYLVDDAEGVTVVDCGAPGYWPQLDPSLEAIGRARGDVVAVVLTHGHSDHVGFSERLRAESGTPVFVPEADEEMVLTGQPQKPERSVLPYLRYPFAYRMLFHLLRNGGARIPKIAEVTTYADGQRLDVPGRPLAIHVPGHTSGTACSSSRTSSSWATRSPRSIRSPAGGDRRSRPPPSTSTAPRHSRRSTGCPGAYSRSVMETRCRTPTS